MDHNNKLRALVDLRVGDMVRRRVDRGRFAKETAKFSDELFVIHEQTRYKYRIKDAQGKLQPRKYKYFELLRIKQPAMVETASHASAGLAPLQKIHKAQQQARKERATVRAGVKRTNILPPSAKRAKRVPARLLD